MIESGRNILVLYPTMIQVERSDLMVRVTTGRSYPLPLSKKRFILTNLSFRSSAGFQPAIEDFQLSKILLDKRAIVYSDDNTLCLRIRQGMVKLPIILEYGWRLTFFIRA
jgi:hypothetical protein